MTRFLLLVLALLMLGGPLLPAAEAGRPTRYARAKMRGRSYTHRPFYKLYKGHKKSKKRLSLFRRKARTSHASGAVGRHSTR